MAGKAPSIPVGALAVSNHELNAIVGYLRRVAGGDRPDPASAGLVMGQGSGPKSFKLRVREAEGGEERQVQAQQRGLTPAKITGMAGECLELNAAVSFEIATTTGRVAKVIGQVRTCRAIQGKIHEVEIEFQRALAPGVGSGGRSGVSVDDSGVVAAKGSVPVADAPVIAIDALEAQLMDVLKRVQAARAAGGDLRADRAQLDALAASLAAA